VFSNAVLVCNLQRRSADNGKHICRGKKVAARAQANSVTALFRQNVTKTTFILPCFPFLLSGIPSGAGAVMYDTRPYLPLLATIVYLSSILPL
jgi:hypothetical protein